MIGLYEASVIIKSYISVLNAFQYNLRVKDADK